MSSSSLSSANTILNHCHFSHLPKTTPSTTITKTPTPPSLSSFPTLFSSKSAVKLNFQIQSMSSTAINNPSSESEWNYSDSDVAQKFLFFNVLKDGRIHVFSPPLNLVPPSFGASFGVEIKDVEISSSISARLILPSSRATNLPVLLYIHGGGFCMNSAFSDEYTRFCSQIAVESNAVVLSVEYGLFPTRPLPACYDDSWTALQWLASHSTGSGPDPLINHHADLNRIFVGGDSAGGNISHTVLSKVGSIGLHGNAAIEGMILIHPYFGEDDKMWMYMCPSNVGPQDPRMKPAVEDLARIGCGRVLVLLAEKDVLYGAGKMYADELSKSGWNGELEIMESKDKEHCFHLGNHTDLEAGVIRKRIASFINRQS
ncbi:putative carboxylesterase 7 [Bienertia sinuspersici]